MWALTGTSASPRLGSKRATRKNHGATAIVGICTTARRGSDFTGERTQRKGATMHRKGLRDLRCGAQLERAPQRHAARRLGRNQRNNRLHETEGRLRTHGKRDKEQTGESGGGPRSDRACILSHGRSMANWQVRGIRPPPGHNPTQGQRPSPRAGSTCCILPSRPGTSKTKRTTPHRQEEFRLGRAMSRARRLQKSTGNGLSREKGAAVVKRDPRVTISQSSVVSVKEKNNTPQKTKRATSQKDINQGTLENPEESIPDGVAHQTRQPGPVRMPGQTMYLTSKTHQPGRQQAL